MRYLLIYANRPTLGPWHVLCTSSRSHAHTAQANVAYTEGGAIFLAGHRLRFNLVQTSFQHNVVPLDSRKEPLGSAVFLNLMDQCDKVTRARAP